MSRNDRPEWARRLQAEREARGWNKHQMARELHKAVGGEYPPIKSLVRQIWSWEKGDHFPRDWTAAYATALDIPAEALFAAPWTTSLSIAGLLHDGPLDASDVERRRLIQGLAALGVLASPATEAVHNIRDAFAAALPNHDLHVVSDWEEIATEHGYAFLTTPASELLRDLAADVVALQQIIRTTRADDRRRELCRPGTQMAMLMALTIGALGNKREARRWWQTARHVADASTDIDLRVWVRGYEAMQALYERRPAELVLARAEEAIAIAHGVPRAATLEAMAARAQALAKLGRAHAAQQEVHDMETVFNGLPSASPLERMSPRAWPETGLRHTQSWVFTHTDHPAATRAQETALRLYPPRMLRQTSQIRLLQATSLVRKGDIAGGIQQARETLERLPADQHTLGIQQGAYDVLSTIPSTELHRPAVIEYRDQLARSAG